MADLFDQALADIERAPPILPTGPLKDPPSDPAATLRRGLRDAPVVRSPRTYVSLEEAQAMIRDRVIRYLADPMPGRKLLIAAPAGIGKTTLAVEIAERRARGSRGRVMYVGPRKEFLDDLRSVSAGLGFIPSSDFDRWWYPWQGRHGGSETMDATCRYPIHIGHWQQRGYKAIDFCSNPRICGWKRVHGPEACAYHAQQTRPQPILFTQYEHISMGHPLLKECQLVIGDELPLRAFLYDTDGTPGWIIPPASIVPEDMESGPLETILRALRALTGVPPEEATTWHGAPLLSALGGPAHVLAVCEAAGISASSAAYAPELRSAGDAADAPYFHLKELVPLLEREARAALQGHRQIARVHVNARGLQLLIRRTPANLPEHVIWLDATANAPLYQRIFGGDIEVVQPDVELRGRVYQVWASLNNKGQFLEGEAPESPRSQAATSKTSALRQQIAQVLARGYTRPGFVGHKDIIDRLAPQGTPPERIAHFGGSRGTNRLQDVDCLIVVGAQQPTTPAMLDIAAMLYQERDIAFDPSWSLRDVPFEGQPYAYPIGGFWNDPDLQTLLEQFRDAELVQSIHRARPLRRAVDIWLLTNVPLRGLPVQLVGLHELYGAVSASGQPLAIKDLARWPAIVRWAEGREGRITAPMVSKEFDVSAPTARQWLEALVATGGFARAKVEPRPGRAPVEICKAFRAPAN